MGSVAIAFSGGVDSTFLVKVAYDVLGKNVLAITANSETYSKDELREAKVLARTIGVRHLVIQTRELDKSDFSQNPPNRCYFCKSELFSRLKKIAQKEKLNYVLDGTNYDDLKDFRPGRKAGCDLGVKSPLAEAGITKKEVRLFSKKMGLPTFAKPSQACLASRFPYGSEITKEKLVQVARAEEFLRKIGIKELRVRHHGEIARIEILPEQFPLILREYKKIVKNLKNLGFTFISLDLEGYRTGSLNETLKDEQKIS